MSVMKIFSEDFEKLKPKINLEEKNFYQKKRKLAEGMMGKRHIYMGISKFSA